MAIEKMYRFKVTSPSSPWGAEEFSAPSCWLMCELEDYVVASELARSISGNVEIFWKMGGEADEKEELISGSPVNYTVEDFVENHQAALENCPVNSHGEVATFHLVVRVMDGAEASGGSLCNQEKDVPDPAGLSFARAKQLPLALPTHNLGPTSASSSMDANAGTLDSVSTASTSSSSMYGPGAVVPYVGSGIHPRPPLALPHLEQKETGRKQLMRPDASDVYVGLVNQAMTCYLNSLLQTLFMTPEFRIALYNWEYTGTDDERYRSIPYQLQKLFVLLQTSVGVKTALETKDLTKSFGWDSSHAWDQHDVQELCRVMFDALEVKWRKTSQATVITALYQGTMKDYVKCLECSTENARKDVFLDLPLAIKPFGANKAYSSVEEALQAFVQPEVLDGTNQYHCEKCQKKVDAHKGLKITKFPYLLTIQLKRFDFDYTTMHRIKLNDRMTFPDLLNLNPFVEPEQSSDDSASGLSDPNVSRDASSTQLDAMDEKTIKTVQSQHSNPVEIAEPAANAHSDSDDEGICVDGTVGGGNSSAGSPIDADEEDGASSEQCDPSLVNSSIDHSLLEHYRKEGPFVYELFSIMVHSGSANGGHYYAYIKNLGTKVWYCFNDQVVIGASIEDIRKTYGGASSSPFMYSSYGSSTNAYMLMYRQIDADRNANLPSSNKLPEHIVRMIDKLHLEEEEQRRAVERQRSLVRVRVYFYHPVDGSLFDKEFEVQKQDLVCTLVITAHKAFGLDSSPYNIPLELCRLIRFSKNKELLEASLDSNRPIQQELPWSYSQPELLLETAPDPGWFRPYYTHGITLKVFVVDVEAGRVQLPKHLLHATKDTTVRELKERLGQLLECDPQWVTLVLDHYTRHLRLLDVPEKTLNDEDVFSQGTLYIHCGQSAIDKNDELENAVSTEQFEKTRFYAILDQFKNSIRIKVALPSASEYEAVGISSPFKVIPAPPALGESCDTAQRPSENFHCPPSGSVTLPTDAGVNSAVPGTRLSLSIHQQEECSTASGSTQYVTPATSRNPSPERADVPMSPVSQGGQSTPGPITPDVDATVSLGNTPSPQVSPDPSPVTGACMDVAPIDVRMGCFPNPHLGYENDLSRIDVDLDWNRANDAAMGDQNFGPYTSADRPLTPSSEKVDYFFDVVSVDPASSLTDTPVLHIEVDKRMPLGEFIQKLAPRVGTASDQFKIYKLFSTTEYECTNSTTVNLDSLSTTNGLRVKLGRPLKDGESWVKFLKFDLSDLEACGKHLFDIALTKEAKVEDIKEECRTMLKRQCGLDVPVDRIRLRDRGIGFMEILHDDTEISDRASFWNSDMYLQLLEEPETATTLQHSAIFVRRWCPSSLSLGPIQEIVLTPKSTGTRQEVEAGLGVDVFVHISRLSNIPLERLQCSPPTAEGTFPYECGKLKLLEDTTFYGLSADQCQQHHSSTSTGCDMDSEGDCRKEQDESGAATTASADNKGFGFDCVAFSYMRSPSRHMAYSHDGVLIYYRDAAEQPKTLSDDERKELQIRDNTKLRKNQTPYGCRKERALKIYTEISSSMADDLD